MTFKPVYIIDGSRTPFLKARNAPGPFSASELAVQTCRNLLLRQSFSATDLDEVIVGCASPSADETNIGRVVGLRVGTGNNVPAWTVMRNCASGMQALDCALLNIQNGRSHLVLAAGTDALSHAPILFSDKMVNWLSTWNSAKSTGQKLQAIRTFRPAYLAPVIGLLKGLNDPVIGISMGQTAENLAWKFGITRQEMDAYSARSHQRSIAAQNRKQLNEITPIIDAKGNLYTEDDGVRADSTPDKLAKLKAVFDRPSGNITAGNSSQVSDGAAALILASEEAVKKWNLKALGKITDCQWAALDPAQMGLGPVHASIPLLQRNNLSLQDPDLWEINEAFAAQVLGCIRAFESEDYCQEHFNTPAWGTLDQEKLNVDGGAIAIGHPVGASGARIVLHLLQALRARNLQRGIATICIGGGQGGAMLIETMKDET